MFFPESSLSHDKRFLFIKGLVDEFDRLCTHILPTLSKCGTLHSLQKVRSWTFRHPPQPHSSKPSSSHFYITKTIVIIILTFLESHSNNSFIGSFCACPPTPLSPRKLHGSSHDRAPCLFSHLWALCVPFGAMNLTAVLGIIYIYFFSM